MKHLIILLLIVGGLSACGQSGRLYLPNEPQTQSSANTQQDNA